MYHFSFEGWECWSVDDARSSNVVGSHSTIMEDVGGDELGVDHRGRVVEVEAGEVLRWDGLETVQEAGRGG